MTGCTTLVPITELATVIRSKNAGPFELTLDIIFKNREKYEYVKGIRYFTHELIAKLYHVSPEDVISIIHFDPAHAIKANIRRPVSSGGPGDTDVYGAQQHAPLLGLEVPMKRDPGP